MVEQPVRVGELLEGLGRRLGFGSAGQIARVWRCWPEIVGEGLAGRAEPTSLRNGVLRLRTESPAWANEVGYLAEEIRDRVNELLGEEVVAEVRVWTAPGRIAGRRRSSPPAGSVQPADTNPKPDGEGHPQEALERARAAWAQRRQQRR